MHPHIFCTRTTGCLREHFYRAAMYDALYYNVRWGVDHVGGDDLAFVTDYGSAGIQASLTRSAQMDAPVWCESEEARQTRANSSSPLYAAEQRQPVERATTRGPVCSHYTAKAMAPRRLYSNCIPGQLDAISSSRRAACLIHRPSSTSRRSQSDPICTALYMAER